MKYVAVPNLEMVSPKWDAVLEESLSAGLFFRDKRKVARTRFPILTFHQFFTL